MKATVRRYIPRKAEVTGPPDYIHATANFAINDMVAMLSGPKFGHIVHYSKVLSVSTPYPGADYDLFLKVLVDDDGHNERFHDERWYVTYIRDENGRTT